MIDILVNSIVQVILFSTVPFTCWLITAHKDYNFFYWIGLKKPVIKGSLRKMLLIIFVASAVYILLMMVVMKQLLTSVDTATTQFEGQGWNALIPILIYALIQTSLSEEILFRGFIGKRLINCFGFTIGNSIQAILFGLVHGIPFGLATGNVLALILLTLIPGAIGWIEGWLNETYASGSIFPGWIMHAIMNILVALRMAF